MWLEITDKVIDLPGIFILKDNPITVGAWNILASKRLFILWILQKRYTVRDIKSGTELIGEKCTFSITDNFNDMHYCGHISGKNENKLEKVLTVFTNGYRYIFGSEYVLLLTLRHTVPLHDYFILVCNIEKVLNFKGGEQWVRLP